MHPMIVHFPVALLLIGPVLVLLALLMGKRGHGVALAALVVMIVGTLTAVMAALTGHVAEHAVKAAGMINDVNHPVLHEHEYYAEWARDIFIVLSCLLLLIIVALKLFGARLKPWVRPAAYGVFVILCIPGYLMLADAADLGARLVHKHGVHADIVSADPAVVQKRAEFVRQAKTKAAEAKPAAVEAR